jgi:two-component system cell cycle sensor histidine kinase PleC
MRVRLHPSIGATIFGAFVAMGLLTAAVGGYGLYVLETAGGFVVNLYDRPLMALNFERAASLDFAEMDRELIRRAIAPDAERAAIDAKIERFSKTFGEDLAVAAERSMYDDERAVIAQIGRLVAQWNELRLGPAKTETAAELDKLSATVFERFDLLAELATGHSFVERRKVGTAIALFKYLGQAALILALALSMGITLILLRRIVRPLREAAAIADRIAAGEMQAPIPEGGRDETGLLLRSMTVMQDNIRIMVEREKAQRRSAQSRLIDALETSREAIILVDSENRIVIANSQLANFFPTVAPKLEQGMSFIDAFRYLDGLVVGTVPTGADASGEINRSDLLSAGSEFRLWDGRWLRVSRSATRDGGFFLLISDFSDMKVREQRLDEARRQAEAASEAKSAFLAAISHELRTPLNAVIGFSEILSGQMFGELGHPKYIDYARSIQHSGTHLLGIINSVLEITKYQAGKLEFWPESVDLVAIAESCIAIMSDQCARAELAVVTHLPDVLMMRGDRGKLQQIMHNLLSNAVKFTRPGGTITVLAEFVADDTVRLQVSDTGIGMAPDEIPIALSVFGQVDTRLERRYDGAGLGLPLAKSLVELHGGRVAIESTPGEGTTVTVQLPREQASSPAANDGEAAAQVA